MVPLGRDRFRRRAGCDGRRSGLAVVPRGGRPPPRGGRRAPRPPHPDQRGGPVRGAAGRVPRGRPAGPADAARGDRRQRRAQPPVGPVPVRGRVGGPGITGWVRGRVHRRPGSGAGRRRGRGGTRRVRPLPRRSDHGRRPADADVLRVGRPGGAVRAVARGARGRPRGSGDGGSGRRVRMAVGAPPAPRAGHGHGGLPLGGDAVLLLRPTRPPRVDAVRGRRRGYLRRAGGVAALRASGLGRPLGDRVEPPGEARGSPDGVAAGRGGTPARGVRGTRVRWLED